MYYANNDIQILINFVAYEQDDRSLPGQGFVKKNK